MSGTLKKAYVAVVIYIMIWLPIATSALTLPQAEKLAIQRDSTIHALMANQHSLQQAGIAADQLSDPKMTLGAMNLPTNSFDLSQEPMTQLTIGLQQQFPHGHSLYYQSQQKIQLAKAFAARANNQQLLVKQYIRQDWINLYYWDRTIQILKRQKELDQQLVKAAESLLANNKTNQQAVFDAELRVSNLDDRILKARQHYCLAQDGLARWIGRRLALTAKVKRFPRFSVHAHLIKQLNDHPLIKNDTALTQASKAELQWAKQQTIPAFALGVAYGYRRGRNMDGSRRSQFVSATVSFDLPLFQTNRQDRTIRANALMVSMRESEQETQYRNLIKWVYEQRHIVQQQTKRMHLFQSRIIPQAKRFSKASFIAYQNAQVDFLSVSKAYQALLNARLHSLNARMTRAKAQVVLLYLQGQ